MMARDGDTPLSSGLAQLAPEALEKLRRGFPLHMDRQGNFSFEGDPLTHPGIVQLFRDSLDATEAGEVTLGLDNKWVYLQLDDLPLRALRVDGPRDDETGPQLLLDDGRRVELDPRTLWEEPGVGLRGTAPARASGRPLAVRFANPALIDLAEFFVWDDDAGDAGDGGDAGDDARPELAIGGQQWRIPEGPLTGG